MSQKYTPGPWAVSKKASRRVTASGVVICNAVLRNQGGPKHKAFMKDEHEAEANAALIAQAPAMIEALRGLIGFVREIQADEQLEATTDGLGILFGDVLAEHLEASEAILAQIDGGAA